MSAQDAAGDAVAVSSIDRSMNVRVSVVLPCLDEAESVGLCVREALEACEAGELTAEVVVVDNGSTDDSASIAAASGARVVDCPVQGYGAALLAGFTAAEGEVVVMADADHTYDLSRVPDLVAPVFADEADLVLGSRLDAATRRTMPWLHRHVGTPVLTFLTSRACGGRVVRDSQSGFRAFRRVPLAELQLHSTGMELASEMLIRSARAGWRIKEIEAGYRPRIGESKLATFADGLRHLQLILLLAPELLLVGPGAAVLALGVVMQIVVLAQPSGLEVGSLRWQPVFFAGIAIVVGVQALLAGAVLANRSPVSSPGVERRYRFVSRPEFPNRCLLAGVLLVAAGIIVNLLLFGVWLSNDDLPPTRNLGYASLAQSLIIVGGTLASYGVIGRIERARTYRERAGRQSAAISSASKGEADPRREARPRA